MFQIFAASSTNGYINVKRYSDKITPATVTDHNDTIRKELLSVDGYILDNRLDESTLNFLSKNYSVLTRLNNFEPLKNIYQSILQDFIPAISDDKLNELKNKLMDITHKLHNRICGNLFVICIPKTTIEDPKKNFQYRSHAYGKPCNCHPKEREIEILQKLQNNQLDPTTLCQNSIIPQYRLMTSPLTPENGVLSFLLTSFPKKEQESLKQEIAQVSLNAYQISQSS